MINAMSKFSDIQNRLLPKIFEIAETSETTESYPNIFKKILEAGRHTCDLALADFGSRLYEVAQDVDFDHPEIKSGAFFSNFMLDATASNKLIQFLELVSLAEEKELDQILPNFSKCIAKAVFKDLKWSFNFLKNQQQYIRLFQEESDRTRLRASKIARQIDLPLSLKKASVIWDSVEDLEAYSRFDNYHQCQVDKIKQRAEVYKQLRLESMCSEILDSLKEFESFEDRYYGFQRISIANAAIILSKMHNCVFNGITSTITMPGSNFTGINFEPTRAADYFYQPMTYPAHTITHSENIGRIIVHLEAMPEANFKPIFDQFIAVVPGIAITWPNKTKNSTKFNLDTMLIEEKCIHPILLGEKDGKVYFISFWE